MRPQVLSQKQEIPSLLFLLILCFLCRLWRSNLGCGFATPSLRAARKISLNLVPLHAGWCLSRTCCFPNGCKESGRDDGLVVLTANHLNEKPSVLMPHPRLFPSCPENKRSSRAEAQGSRRRNSVRTTTFRLCVPAPPREKHLQAMPLFTLRRVPPGQCCLLVMRRTRYYDFFR